MRVSWKWLSELVDLSTFSSPEALAEALTSRGLEVEAITRQGAGLEQVVTAQILERGKHPEADRLSLCKVTTGNGEPLDIVCGAQNMKSGDKVALAQIGAKLPNGLKIEKSKIRGVASFGMLCSEEELGLKESSEGIVILPVDAPLGVPLPQFLGLDDVILELKLTPNRADCLSHRGLAREIESIVRVLKSKAAGQYLCHPKLAELPEGGSPIALALDAGEDGPQFFGAYVEGVKVGPSPEWVVKRLEAVGLRSINNVVDATNLVMMEFGHPVHAYDASKIEGGLLSIRKARAGETLKLLDDTEAKLEGWELVIADTKKAVGLAGVMGGGNSEVQSSTTNLFLECAEFSPSLVRKASSHHGKKSEASHRFERGIDPESASTAVRRLTQWVLDLAGGKVMGSVKALHPSRDPKSRPFEKTITVSYDYFPSFLGLDVSVSEVRMHLEALGCRVAGPDNAWQVTPPTWRLDLNLKEDLAEEVARSVGYDRVGSTLPALSSRPRVAEETTGQLTAAGILDAAKDALVAQGMRETVQYAFTSGAWLKQLGFESSVRVVNPLSEEQEYMVPSLVPGLVQQAQHNLSHHFGSESLPVRLFEVRPTFSASGEIRSQLLPGSHVQGVTGVTEKWRVALVLSGPRWAEAMGQDRVDVDFSDLKAVIQGWVEALGVRGARFRIPQTGFPALFHSGKSAELVVGKDSVGYFGLLHPKWAKTLKLKQALWIAEFDYEAVAKASVRLPSVPQYKAWSHFPTMERDFALLVRDGVTAEQMTTVATKVGKPLVKQAKVFDVYRGAQVTQGMTSVAVRIIFGDEGRSLQEAEVEGVCTQILAKWKQELGAELRG